MITLECETQRILIVDDTRLSNQIMKDKLILLYIRRKMWGGIESAADQIEYVLI